MHHYYQAMHRAVRKGIIVCVVCMLLMCSVFIYYANKIQSSSTSQSQLVQALATNEATKRIASQIIIEVEKARVHNQNPELWPYFDEIESLAYSVTGE